MIAIGKGTSSSNNTDFILVSVSTGAEVETDWRLEKLKREFERLINRIRSIIEIKRIDVRHQRETKKRIQQAWYDQPLYHLRLSKSEWSGKNFCKV